MTSFGDGEVRESACAQSGRASTSGNQIDGVVLGFMFVSVVHPPISGSPRAAEEGRLGVQDTGPWLVPGLPGAKTPRHVAGSERPATVAWERLPAGQNFKAMPSDPSHSPRSPPLYEAVLSPSSSRCTPSVKVESPRFATR